MANKKKSNYTHKERQAHGFWDEIDRVSRELAESKKPPALSDVVDPPWLNLCSEDNREAYLKWKKRGFEKNGKVFVDATRLILGKSLKNAGLWDQAAHPFRMASSVIYIKELCERLDENFDQYKSRIMLAAERDCGITDAINFHTIVPAGPKCGDEEQSFHYTLPSLIVEFLHTSPSAEGQQKTDSSTYMLLVEEVLQDNNLKLRLSAAMLCLYIYITQDYCKRVRFLNDKAKRELSTAIRRSMSNTDNHKEIISKVMSHNNPGYNAVGDFLGLDNNAMRDELNAYSQRLEGNASLEYLLGASSAFGVSKKSLFWIYLLKMHGAEMYLRLEDHFFEDNAHIDETILLTVSRIKSKINNEYQKRLKELEQTIKEAEQVRTKAEAASATVEKRVQEAQKEARAAQRELDAAKEEIERLTTENEALSEDVEQLRRTCKEMEDTSLQVPESEGDQEPVALDYPIRSTKKVLIYGGHATWVAPMRQRFPDCTFMSGADSYNYDGVASADIIIFQTNAISHSSYKSVKPIAATNKIPVKYFEKAGVDNCSRQLYAILQEIDALV